MSLSEYRHLLGLGTLACRQVLILCWLRAARTADVLALRRGSLWEKDQCLAIELGVEKSRSLGMPGYVEVRLPSRERLILSPLLSSEKPVTRPMDRPALFPEMDYATFHDYIINNRPPGSTSTPHSLRKGAIQAMVQAGVPLRDIALISQHKTVEGLTAYLSSTDLETQRRMHSASAAIAGLDSHDLGRGALSP